MIYVLKIFTTLLGWIVITLLVGLVFLKNARKEGRKEKFGWYLSLTAVLMLVLSSTPPVSNLLVYSLEHPYRLPSQEALSDLDAMIILPAGARPSHVFAEGAEATGKTYSRLVSGVTLFKESHAKLLVLPGASRLDIEIEARVMAGLAKQLGVPEDKILIESRSRNTLEHAIELRKMLPPSQKLRLGLVTSAMHMRRSLMVFQWEFPEDILVPIPVACRHSALKYDIKDFAPSVEAFKLSSVAFHEWTGMMWYLLQHAGERVGILYPRGTDRSQG